MIVPACGALRNANDRRNRLPVGRATITRELNGCRKEGRMEVEIAHDGM